MQPTRTFIRSPQVCRVLRNPVATRNMSLFSAPPAPFFGRIPSASYPTIGSELAPFFRMVDDFTNAIRASDHFSPPARIRTFEPRFDVREVDGAYELRGELPGVESKDLEVEFTDGQTLVIRGRTESETSASSPPAPAEAIEAATPTTTVDATADNSDAVSTHSTGSYKKPSVEDEGAAEVSTTSTSTPGQATPTESATSETPQQTLQTTATPAEQQQAQANTPRYWVSERSTGSFQRIFRFPARVNHDGVTASLKNGILNVVVPKAIAAGSRRITVE